MYTTTLTSKGSLCPGTLTLNPSSLVPDKPPFILVGTSMMLFWPPTLGQNWMNHQSVNQALWKTLGTQIVQSGLYGRQGRAPLPALPKKWRHLLGDLLSYSTFHCQILSSIIWLLPDLSSLSYPLSLLSAEPLEVKVLTFNPCLRLYFLEK